MKILSLLGEMVINGVIVEKKVFTRGGNTIPVVYVHKGERSIYIPVVLTKESLAKWDAEGRVLITRGSFETYDDRKFFLRENTAISSHHQGKGSLLFARGLFLMPEDVISISSKDRLNLRDDKFRGFPWLHLKDDYTSSLDVGTLHFATSKTVVISNEESVTTAQQYNFVLELNGHGSAEVELVPLKRENIVEVMKNGRKDILDDVLSYQRVKINL